MDLIEVERTILEQFRRSGGCAAEQDQNASHPVSLARKERSSLKSHGGRGEEAGITCKVKFTRASSSPQVFSFAVLCFMILT